MASSEETIILASASPRRVELLAQLGFEPSVHPQDIDETQREHESPEVYVERMAREKARSAAAALECAPALILAADTVVSLGDEVFGKPADAAQAQETLLRLSGRSHVVRTAICVLARDAGGEVREIGARVVPTQVTFTEIDAGTAARYWASGEPRGKAGGYAIQGLGAQFVARIEGSYSAVMGLPLFEVAELFARAGVPCLPQLAAEQYE